MVTKSLPTFKHTSIGAKTHKARTATAHLSYIMRSEAMTKFQAENMPDGGRGTRVFFDKLWEKAGMPDNARIADKLMIALPVELNQEQRYELVRSFMHELGKGRIAWCAAHHDRGQDEHNPHAHIIFKDADIDTGRKVVGTTTSARDVREAKEHGWKIPPRTTTADMRKMWCDHLNDFMERAGIDVRYDARTLKEQGIERDPQIHIGPKAQALDEKGYQFESHDQTRGKRSIPYSMLDHDSRAAHNSHIIEANKQKEREQAAGMSANGAQSRQPHSSIHGATREDQEKRALREAQGQARREMYKDQQRDRDALRQAQNPAKIEHQKWAKKLYAAARKTAYEKVKEQYAEKWQEVRGIKNLDERQKAAAALKLAQKKSYEEEATRQVNQCRPEKDAAWKALWTQQEKERLNLRSAHRKEISALTRQHIAERLGVHEKWRARSHDKHANRIDARLSTHQSMAAQQKAALDTIKLHSRTGRVTRPGGDAAASSNPREAARAHFETARAEEAKHDAIRQKLLEDRTRNFERAGITADKSHDGSGQRCLAGGRATGNGSATGKGSPREIIVPGIHAASGNRASTLQQRLSEIHPQQQIRQATASGRTLSSEERATASPEIKEQLARKDRQAHSFFTDADSQQQDHGKGGRNGGGRGR
ncbi:MAG: MobA/MobL family protein [Rhodomicrobium sp.]